MPSRNPMARLPVALAIALPVLLTLAAPAVASPPAIAGIERGREVWKGSCALCHTEPDSGAPQMGDTDAWRPRLDKGRDVLYVSALEGFVGPGGDEMPPRGGNPGLSDDDVKAAVDHMLAALGAD